jgi:O-antigen/teichoic acid export membrane protein
MTTNLSPIKSNIIANLIGTSVVTLLTFVITPIQINILGMHAYGVVGFIATIQVIFSMLDMGLSNTLIRELSVDRSLHKQLSKDLSDVSLTFSLRVIGLYLALRWPVAMYIGILSGMQQMIILNKIKIGVAVIRLGGGVIILLLYRTLDSFLMWMAASAVIEVIIYWLICKKCFLKSLTPGNFSIKEIKRVWRFSSGMGFLSLIAILIIQMDRLVISKVGSLESLGYYNLAYTAASIMIIFLSSFSSATIPWFGNSLDMDNRNEILRRYQDSTLLLLLSIGIIGSILVFYSHLILTLWVGQVIADITSPILVLLVLGSWCAAAIANLSNVAIAFGKINWHVKANLILFVPYCAMLFWSVKGYGPIGAAASWIFLNIGYAFLLVGPVNKYLLGTSTFLWIREILIPALIVTLISFVPIKIFSIYLNFSIFWQFFMMFISCLIYLFLGYLFLPNSLRKIIINNFFHRKITVI